MSFAVRFVSKIRFELLIKQFRALDVFGVPPYYTGCRIAKTQYFAGISIKAVKKVNQLDWVQLVFVDRGIFSFEISQKFYE